MTRIADNVIASGYDTIADSVFESDSMYRDTLRLARDCHGNVLDIGCGGGLFLEMLKQECPSISTLFGCDISSKMCELSAQRVPSAQVYQTNAENLAGFDDGEFDFAFMVASLEHVQDHLTALTAAGRVLRESGVLVVVVPNREWWLYARWRRNHIQVQPIDDYWFSPAELQDLVRRAGFEVEALRGAWALLRSDWRHHLENGAATVFPLLHRRMKCIGVRARKV